MKNKEEFNTIVDKDYRDTCGNEILSKINITQCVHETTCTLRFDVKSLPQQCRINSDIFSPSEDPYLVGYATCEGKLKAF